MSDHKKRATDALNKFYQRQLDQAKPREGVKKHNDTPEKDVERECLKWMRSRGWTVNIYEAKAKWNSEAERYTSAGMRFGTCDCMGNDDQGIAVAVEFKAPGSRSTFNSEARYLQREFILKRIASNAFACVVDSAQMLQMIYKGWRERRLKSMELARDYLLEQLPQMKEKTRLKRDRLFDDEDVG